MGFIPSIYLSKLKEIFALKTHVHPISIEQTESIKATSNYTASGSITCSVAGKVIIVAGEGVGTYTIKKGTSVEATGNYVSYYPYEVDCAAGDTITFSVAGQGSVLLSTNWGKIILVGVDAAINV